MKKILIIILVVCQSIFAFSQSENWKAKRITSRHSQNKSNTWQNFRKELELNSVPDQAIAKIACDSKYWLWVNGEMAVFEGQVKRGPRNTMNRSKRWLCVSWNTAQDLHYTTS